MKCFFDTNLSPKLAKTLDFLEGEDGIRVKHLNEKFQSNTPDTVWIEKLKNEGDWFVITKDNQIKKRHHERKAWKESNLPIVFLPKTWIKLNFWEQAWRLIRYWPDLKENINRCRKNESLELSINGKITIVA
jgi:hypothetical protein